jgi:glycosyltransferase involved in cell wall biosynthesis
MTPGEVEVIVVPNGPDQSWRESLASYRNNLSVRVLPIEIGHANVARNHGLTLARGKYVRFLDDDDYLLQPVAMEQVDLLERTGAEICSGLVLNVDKDLSPLGMLTFPETRDFVVSTMTVSGFQLPVGNLFVRGALVSAGASWRSDVHRLQDLVWMLDLAGLREWNWKHLPKPVGVWYQHDAERVSTVRLSSDKPIRVIDTLFKLHGKLRASGRLTEERQHAWASLMWNYIHWRIPFDVHYWTVVAKQVAKLAPGSRPEHAVFEKWFLRNMDPVLAEFLLAFPRKLTNWHRERKRDRTGWDYRRHV